MARIAKQEIDDNKKGRGRKLRSVGLSDKTSEYLAAFDRKSSKKERLQDKKQSTRKHKQRAKDAFDLIKGDLSDEDAELIGDLMQDKEEEGVIESFFQKAFSTLQEDASSPNADFRTDSAAKNMQRAKLALILSLIPVAELTYLKDPKQSSAYALMSFMDQARQLTEDLRTISDADGQSDFITRRIVAPAFLNAGQVLLTEVTAYKGSIDTEVRDPHTSKMLKRALDATAISFAKYLTEMQRSLSAQVAAYLQGDASAFEVPAAFHGTAKVSRKKKKRRADFQQ